MLQDNKLLRKEVETGRRARSDAVKSLKQCADEMSAPDSQDLPGLKAALPTEKIALNGNVAKVRNARRAELDTLRRTIVKAVDDIKKRAKD